MTGIALLALPACSSDDSTSPPLPSTTAAAPTTTVRTTVGTVSAGPGTPTVSVVATLEGPGGFDDPSFVSVDEDTRRVYVTDGGNGRIVAAALDGGETTVLLDDGEPFRFEDHGALGSADVLADGSLVVAESGEGRVLHLSSEGRLLDEVATPDGFDRLFSASVGPGGLAYAVDDESGDLTVVEVAAARAVDHLGSPGDRPGQLGDPGSVEVLDDGTLWLADAGNERLQHLGPDGEVLQVVGPFEDGEPGWMDYPNDLAVDEDGRLWVTDFDAGGLVAFDADGVPIGRYDLPELDEPVSIAWSAGRLYVSEWSDDVVVVLAVS